MKIQYNAEDFTFSYTEPGIPKELMYLLLICDNIYIYGNPNQYRDQLWKVLHLNQI